MLSSNRNPSFKSYQPSNGNWLPNALLSDTKSEIAVPISIGSEALGVVDVQQNTVNYLQKEDTDFLEALAYQVTVRELGSALIGKDSRIALSLPDSMLDQGC